MLWYSKDWVSIFYFSGSKQQSVSFLTQIQLHNTHDQHWFTLTRWVTYLPTHVYRLMDRQIVGQNHSLTKPFNGLSEKDNRQISILDLSILLVKLKSENTEYAWEKKSIK